MKYNRNLKKVKNHWSLMFNARGLKVQKFNDIRLNTFFVFISANETLVLPLDLNILRVNVRPKTLSYEIIPHQI
jgi:hypothetical protein